MATQTKTQPQLPRIQYSGFAVKIADGSYVGFGHIVQNFNCRCVVVGYHTEAESLIVRELDANGKMLPKGTHQWAANPKFCTKAD